MSVALLILSIMNLVLSIYIISRLQIIRRKAGDAALWSDLNRAKINDVWVYCKTHLIKTKKKVS